MEAQQQSVVELCAKTGSSFFLGEGSFLSFIFIWDFKSLMQFRRDFTLDGSQDIMTMAWWDDEKLRSTWHRPNCSPQEMRCAEISRVHIHRLLCLWINGAHTVTGDFLHSVWFLCMRCIYCRALSGIYGRQRMKPSQFGVHESHGITRGWIFNLHHHHVRSLQCYWHSHQPLLHLMFLLMFVWYHNKLNISM